MCVCVPDHGLQAPPPPDTHTPASPPPLGVCGGDLLADTIMYPIYALPYTRAHTHPSRRPHHACLSSVKLGLSSAPRINYWVTHRVFDLHRRTN